MPRPSTFETDLFDNFARYFVPRGFDGRRVFGYIDNSKHYGNSCSAIALDIHYDRRAVDLYFIPYKGRPFNKMSEEELFEGDMFLTLKHNPEDWASFEESMGTYSQLRERILAVERAENDNNEDNGAAGGAGAIAPAGRRRKSRAARRAHKSRAGRKTRKSA